MVLKVLTSIHSGLIHARNFLYDAGLADTIRLHCPVVSIGNLSVGGTGKTPVTDWLLNYLDSKNKKSLIVSRNYKAALKGTEKVNLQFPRAAFFYGDEPTWLAVRHPLSSVYVGPQKWKAALKATEQETFDIAVIDDGFQHRSLARELDIVLIDATANDDEDHLLPRGRAREPLSSLERSDWVFITKANLVSEDDLQKKIAQVPAEIPYLLFDYTLQLPFDLTSDSKVILASGLARPETFEKSVQQIAEFKIIDCIRFADHFSYTAKDWKILQDKLKDSGADAILTTEKDFIKLQNVVDSEAPLRVAHLSVQPRGDVERFLMEIDLIVG
jgi:tetraacyldisaccharide 4'-kinase